MVFTALRSFLPSTNESSDSGRLLSRLLLLWFNPTAVNFKKYLAIFLDKYASKSQEHQEAILESFVPTLTQIIKAPETSPISKINVDKVGDRERTTDDIMTNRQMTATNPQNDGDQPTTK